MTDLFKEVVPDNKKDFNFNKRRWEKISTAKNVTQEQSNHMHLNRLNRQGERMNI